jgi:site-specific DNA-methyltransferase (adenine-specific)
MEKNKIYQGDCLEKMKQIKDESVDLVVTSPPYNVGIDYDSWDDKMGWGDYWKFTENWLKECFRVLKKDGRICINNYFSFGNSKHRVAPLMEINRIAINIGFKHHSVGMWMDRTLAKRTAWGSWLSASAPYINSPFEGILIMYKQDWKKHNRGKSTISREDFIDLTRGIWKIGTQSKQLTKANFPIELPKKCIDLLTFEGDLVLDPFAGSGTTGLACKELNREYILIEISEEYCRIIKERLSQTKLQEGRVS